MEKNECPRPMFTISHPQRGGLGVAARFTLYPADGINGGKILVELTHQDSCGGFHWDNAMYANIRIDEILELIDVLNDETESAYEGYGIVKRDDDGNIVKIEFYHNARHEHVLEMKDAIGDNYIVFSRTEAYSIREALVNAIPLVKFGVPK